MIPKLCLLILVFTAVLCADVSFSFAENRKEPFFELSGIVKKVSENSIEVYSPYINKNILVKVLPGTRVTNRINAQSQAYESGMINNEDLVAIVGVLEKDCLRCSKISYIPQN